jgi:hypothetical protein
LHVGREAAELYAGLVRSLMPVLTAHGIATTDQVDIDTLADRLQAIAGEEDLVLLYPPTRCSLGPQAPSELTSSPARPNNLRLVYLRPDNAGTRPERRI